MAERVTVELVDDLDGSVADETVHFTWDGKSLIIDLNKKNADRLRKAVEPFVAASRPDETVRAPSSRRRLSSGSPSGKRQPIGSGAATNVIRAWAKENSIAVPRPWPTEARCDPGVGGRRQARGVRE